MTLMVYAPSTHAPERRYALETVLGEWLGLDFELGRGDPGQVTIRVSGDSDGLELTVPDVFFGMPAQDWLTERSVPAARLAEVETGPGTEPGQAGLRDVAAGPRPATTPVMFGDTGSDPRWWRPADRGLVLRVDVFGSAFFALTRYEEAVGRALDEFGRFPAVASLARRGDFLHRPLVDEYVDLLWLALRALWPSLDRRPTEFNLHLTHDVDRPWAVTGQSAFGLGRSLAADLVRRRDTALAAQRLRAVVEARSGRLDHDPYNTFDFLMDTSERFGLRSTFYFMAGTDVVGLDATYQLTDPPVADLLQRIGRRGHEVGLHSSFMTDRSSSLMRREFDDLRAACQAGGIEQSTWSVRQHYLRFSVPETWRIQAEAGLAYDSTVGYAEANGFRAGTCREYPVFDLESRRTLQLRERPLVMMEAASPEYLAGDLDEAAARTLELVTECRRHRGDAVLLYHNSSLPSSRQRARYRELVEAIVNGA
jgi:hypothetical protein